MRTLVAVLFLLMFYAQTLRAWSPPENKWEDTKCEKELKDLRSKSSKLRALASSQPQFCISSADCTLLGGIVGCDCNSGFSMSLTVLKNIEPISEFKEALSNFRRMCSRLIMHRSSCECYVPPTKSICSIDLLCAKDPK